MPTPIVSIVIPTFRRNDGLRNAVNSILAMNDKALETAEIVIADNTKEAGAQSTAEELAANSRVPIHYVTEPDPGVANARNNGLSKAQSNLIAFIDDDETAHDGWLDGLLAAHKQLSAAVIFGPVETVLPPEAPEAHKTYLEDFFSRKGPDETKAIDTAFGCGNALLDLERIRPCLDEDEPYFNKIANETGGEDDYLFAKVEKAGETFGWAHNAIVDEHVPAKRSHLGYTLRRAFAYGQGPSTNCVRNSKTVDVPRLLMWMVIGTGQFTIYGLLALLMLLMRHPRRAYMYDKAVRGLGKLLWFPPFEFKFYGDNTKKKKNSGTQSSAATT